MSSSPFGELKLCCIADFLSVICMFICFFCIDIHFVCHLPILSFSPLLFFNYFAPTNSCSCLKKHSSIWHIFYFHSFDFICLLLIAVVLYFRLSFHSMFLSVRLSVCLYIYPLSVCPSFSILFYLYLTIESVSLFYNLCRNTLNTKI